MSKVKEKFTVYICKKLLGYVPLELADKSQLQNYKCSIKNEKVVTLECLLKTTEDSLHTLIKRQKPLEEAIRKLQYRLNKVQYENNKKAYRLKRLENFK